MGSVGSGQGSFTRKSCPSDMSDVSNDDWAFDVPYLVLIDATLVRGLLVPATMRLLGRSSWWAPTPVRRVVDRLGLGHEEPMPFNAPTRAVAD